MGSRPERPRHRRRYLLERQGLHIEDQRDLLPYNHICITTIEKLANLAKDRDDLVGVLKEHWLKRISAGEFFAIAVAPLGRMRMDFGRILAEFSFEAMQRQFKDPARVGVMEQPEDLGRTSCERIPGHSPASMWQLHQFQEILTLQAVETVVFSQVDFGSQSPKPTRFLLRFLVEPHPGMRAGPPQFDSDGFYMAMGPLERRQGSSLIGYKDGKFRTAASASCPPPLCEWVANASVASYNHASDRTGGSNNFSSEKNNFSSEKTETTDFGEQPAKKARLDETEQEVDPMNPPFVGGTGCPRRRA